MTASRIDWSGWGGVRAWLLGSALEQYWCSRQGNVWKLVPSGWERWRARSPEKSGVTMGTGAHRFTRLGCNRASVLLVLAGVGVLADVASMSPPGRVDGASLYFQNVTHSSAVLRWAPPERGDWGMEIEGYRLRIRSFLYTEEMFDISLDDPDERYQDASFPCRMRSVAL